MRTVMLGMLLLASSSCGAAVPLAAPDPTQAPLANERLLVEGAASTDIIEAATGRTVRSLAAGIVSPTGKLVVHVASDGVAKTAVAGIDLDGQADFGLALDGATAFRRHTARRPAASRRTAAGSCWSSVGSRRAGSP